MKRVLVLGFIALLVLIMSVSVFAADGVGSPGSKNAPELIDAWGYTSNGALDCFEFIKITSLVDAEGEALKGLEMALNTYKNNENLGKLVPGVNELAAANGYDVNKLEISELFDITHIPAEGHENETSYAITIKPETLEDFVCLVHFDGEKWHIVEDATVVNENQLHFTTEKLSPFAIVLDTSEVEPQAPTFLESISDLFGLTTTGTIGIIIIIAIIMMLFMVFSF